MLMMALMMMMVIMSTMVPDNYASDYAEADDNYTESYDEIINYKGGHLSPN